METLDYETPNPEPYPNRASPEEEALWRWQRGVSQNTERGKVRAVAALGAEQEASKAEAFRIPRSLTDAEAEAQMRHHLRLAIIFGAAIGVAA